MTPRRAKTRRQRAAGPGFGSAPCRKRQRATLTRPDRIDSQSGEMPALSTPRRSAPRRARSATMATCPLNAATYTGLSRCTSGASMSHPWFVSNAATSSRPFNAAKCSAYQVHGIEQFESRHVCTRRVLFF